MTDLILRQADARPQSFNDAERTVEATICTDTPVPRMDERGPYFEILDMDGVDLNAMRGVSVLDSHRTQDGVSNVLGDIAEAWREGNAIVAKIRLSARADQALIEDVKSGVLKHFSVGYSVEQWSESNEN